jgi:hypothetical protein
METCAHYSGSAVRGLSRRSGCKHSRSVHSPRPHSEDDLNRDLRHANARVNINGIGNMCSHGNPQDHDRVPQPRGRGLVHDIVQPGKTGHSTCIRPAVYLIFSQVDILLEHYNIYHRLHHMCRCTRLGRAHIRESRSRLFHGWGFYGWPRDSRLRRLKAQSPPLHLLYIYHVHGGIDRGPCPGRCIHRKQPDLEVLLLGQSSWVYFFLLFSWPRTPLLAHAVTGVQRG